MKLFIVSIISFILVSCGNDVYIADNKADIDVEDPAGSDLEETSTTTTTTTTVTTTKEDAVEDPRRVLNLYTLEHESGLTDEFVSPDYCSGISYRECRIRSVLLKEYVDGFKISIEWQDTFTAAEYFITKGDVDGDAAFRLADDVKLNDDDSATPRSLWVIVHLEDLTLEVIYDKVGAGPNEQGVDSLDKFDFILSNDS